VGGSPAGTEGLDLLLTDLGDRYHVAILTDAGRALIAGPVRLPATDADAAAAAERHVAAIDKMPARFDAEAIAGKVEWGSPLWMRHAQRCLACGACSFLCPTCHCFDIQDEVTAEGGVRFRCWDTCQFGEFTRMGAGHNPRQTQTERLRQRISHKFKYLVEEFGRMGCTGCGRCVEACPVNIDIRSVLSEIEGGER
jgi:ferredoxin